MHRKPYCDFPGQTLYICRTILFTTTDSMRFYIIFYATLLLLGASTFYGCSIHISKKGAKDKAISDILEVIELDIIESSRLTKKNWKGDYYYPLPKKVWMNEFVYGMNCPSSGLDDIINRIRANGCSKSGSKEGYTLKDSMCVEEYAKDIYWAWGTGIDTIWDYATKLEYFSKTINCPSNYQLQKSDFPSRKIRFREGSFKTWRYSSAIWLNNGEYVLFHKSMVCGSICSYDAYMLYRKVNGKWICLPTLMAISMK